MKLNKQADYQRLSKITRHFRQELQLGKRPSIEAHLSSVSDSEKGALFRELLSVEIWNSRCAGDDPCIETYLEQFPDFAEIIREQFGGIASFATSMNSTTSQGSSGDIAFSEGIPQESPKPQLERYRLLEQLGKGGFGVVWRAFDEQTKRYVAIKGPRTDRVVTPSRVAKFLAEARRVREVDVVGVVKVLDIIHYDSPQANGSVCFIVMELMEGGSLADRLPDVSRRQAIHWLVSLSDTLGELHRQGVVHRDVKPENILFDKQDRPHLSDFGLAATETEQLAEAPGVLGTVAYMSPEQARGSHVDRRADIYSLGVVLYRILSNDRFPYLANNRQEYLNQLLDEHVVPRALPDTVPARLLRACERCVHKQATQRYRTATELGRELRAWHDRVRNRAGVLAVAGGLLLAGIAAAAYSTPVSNRSEQIAGTAPQQGSAILERQEQRVEPRVDETKVLTMLPIAPVTEASIGSNIRLAVDEIVWRYSDTTSWSLANAGNSLQVSSGQISLLAVGQLRQSQDLSFDVDIHQLDWTGNAGVFVGHRVGLDGRSRFELIELRNYDGQFEILRSIRDYEQTPDGIGEFQLARAEIPRPEGPQVLSLKITAGKIVEIRWNGESLTRLVDLRPGLVGRIEDCSGEIGFFNSNSTAEYSRVHLDHDLVRMREQETANSL